MNSKLIAAFFLGAVLLGGCSQENETEAALVSPSSETSAPVEPSIDACQVFAESQVQLTEAISEFAGNPSQDALNLLAASFDAPSDVQNMPHVAKNGNARGGQQFQILRKLISM